METDIVGEVLAEEEVCEGRLPFVLPYEPVLVSALPLGALENDTNPVSTLKTDNTTQG